MAREIKTFDMFGVHYRVRQYDAVSGMGIMSRTAAAAPVEILEGSQVFAHTNDNPQGEWVALDSNGINKWVLDRAGVMAPAQVLAILVQFVIDFNFSFSATWKGVHIPSRLIADAPSVQSNYSPTMISTLIASKVATMKELEEYYSVRDAFSMFDILTAKGVNEALANEAAMKKAKQ